MNRTKTLVAGPRGAAIAVGLLLLALLVLAGCAEPVAIAAVPPTATVYAALPTKTPSTPEPTPVAMTFPLAAPTKESATAPGDDQTCVDCHKDEAQLKDTAEEVVAAESLSEGEG